MSDNFQDLQDGYDEEIDEDEDEEEDSEEGEDDDSDDDDEETETWQVIGGGAKVWARVDLGA